MLLAFKSHPLRMAGRNDSDFSAFGNATDSFNITAEPPRLAEYTSISSSEVLSPRWVFVAHRVWDKALELRNIIYCNNYDDLVGRERRMNTSLSDVMRMHTR